LYDGICAGNGETFPNELVTYGAIALDPPLAA
jgi:hypothetical protein